MAESPMVGARISLDWHKQIQQIAQAAGRKESEVVREAITQYLGITDRDNVKGAIADLQDRVSRLERRLRGWSS